MNRSSVVNIETILNSFFIQQLGFSFLNGLEWPQKALTHGWMRDVHFSSKLIPKTLSLVRISTAACAAQLLRSKTTSQTAGRPRDWQWALVSGKAAVPIGFNIAAPLVPHQRFKEFMWCGEAVGKSISKWYGLISPSLVRNIVNGFRLSHPFIIRPWGTLVQDLAALQSALSKNTSWNSLPSMPLFNAMSILGMNSALYLVVIARKMH